MNREKLRIVPLEYVSKYSHVTFDEAIRFRDDPVADHHGTPGADDFCQVTVRLLENENSYRRPYVTVDDGQGFLGVVKQLTGTVIVHRDGRIETDPDVSSTS